MVERHIESALHVGMAGEAKRRLGQDKKTFFRLRRVDTVAADAAEAGLGMGRALEIRMHPGMTTKASGICFLRRRFAGQENLGDVPAALNVGLTRSVTALTGNPLAAMSQRQFRMGVGGKVLAYFRVTGDTSVGAHITRCPCGSRGGSLRSAGLLGGFTRGVRDSGMPEPGECDQQRNTLEQAFHRASTFKVQQDLEWIKEKPPVVL